MVSLFCGLFFGCRHRKHTVRIRGGQGHNTAVEPKGVQPCVTQPPASDLRPHANKPTSLLIFFVECPHCVDRICIAMLDTPARCRLTDRDPVPGQPRSAARRSGLCVQLCTPGCRRWVFVMSTTTHVLQTVVLSRTI